MSFVSYADLVRDVRLWSQQLPSDIVAVAGIPRSGTLVAGLLALHRNIHLIDAADVVLRPWESATRRTPGRSKMSANILLVDDSISTGDTTREFCDAMDWKGLRGAMYYSDEQPEGILTYRHVPHNRCFEWNVFHGRQMNFACVDMDGMLCEEWHGDETTDPEAYRVHLAKARPLHVPSVLVDSIVTSRLECYRAETMQWLAEHGIDYRKLVMSPHATAAERRAAGDHAQRKADYYRTRKNSRLFVESNAKQAAFIAKSTGLPVLCTDTMELLRGESCRHD